MRGGKLLTQSKPEDLIRAYNAVVCNDAIVFVWEIKQKLYIPYSRKGPVYSG